MSEGVLGAIVWPPYVGLASGDPGAGPVAEHEPYEDINYTRGQIVWRTLPDGEIVGAAQVAAPKGIYTHVVFFAGPQKPMMMGSNKFEQPIIFDHPGIVEINPIANQDYLPRM